jgi:hypothetical protein
VRERWAAAARRVIQQNEMFSSPFLWYRFVLAAFHPKFTEKCLLGEEEGDNENRCLVTIFTCDQVMDVGKRFLESMMSSSCMTKLHQVDYSIIPPYWNSFLHIGILKLPIDKLLSVENVLYHKISEISKMNRRFPCCSTYTSMCV